MNDQTADSSKIILIDDDKDNLFLLKEFINCNIKNTEVFLSQNVEDGLLLFKKHLPNVAVVDLTINKIEGPKSGLNLVKEILNFDPTTRIIILTGQSISEYGVRALEVGATSFLEKPVDLRHFIALVKDSINTSNLKRELRNFKKESFSNIKNDLKTKSSIMDDVIEKINLATICNLPVLLTGETGTGKGVVAELIHKYSSRKDKRFIKYLPTYSSGDHINSELYGHTKNAFTGASNCRKGLIQQSDKGTFFIDEINEFPYEVQSLFLGVLQDKRFRAVGSDEEQLSDFRLISAMNKEPKKEIEAKKLREDLYYRISKIEIKIPPLRERKEDIPLLARYFLEVEANINLYNPIELTECSVEKLRSYSWPGNTRELLGVVEKAFWKCKIKNLQTICEYDIEIQEEALKSDLRNFDSAYEHKFNDLNTHLANYRRELVLKELAKNSGNQIRTASILGIDRGTLKRIVS